MRDFSRSTYQRKKVAVNKVKIKRKPIEWGKYLRPLGTIALGVAGVSLLFGILFINVVFQTGFCVFVPAVSVEFLLPNWKFTHQPGPCGSSWRW